MENHEEKDKEQSYIFETESGEKEIHLDVFVKTLLQRYMGEALDLARVSPMTDRQLTQFSRKMKDYCYKIAKDGAIILDQLGYKVHDKS